MVTFVPGRPVVGVIEKVVSGTECLAVPEKVELTTVAVIMLSVEGMGTLIGTVTDVVKAPLASGKTEARFHGLPPVTAY